MSVNSLVWICSLFLSATSIIASSVDSYDSVVLQLLGSKYTVFVKLLDEANVLNEIEQEGHLAKGITVFAPSDRYLMENVSPNVLSFLSQPQNIAHLRKVLRHHIAYGKVGEGSWYSGDTLESMSGDRIQLHMDGDMLKAGSAVIKELSTLESADGIVHTVHGLFISDEVSQAIQLAESLQTVEEGRRSLVYFPTATQTASAPSPAPALDLTQMITKALNGAQSYGTFLSLLTLSLLSNITDIIENGQTLTLVAPDDNAFSDLSVYGKLNESQIADVLLYHVIIGAYSFDDLALIGSGNSNLAPSPSSSPFGRRLLQAGTGTLKTLSNDSVIIETTPTSSGLPSVIIGSSLIVLPDILDGGVGVSIQGVDVVLLPPGFVNAPPPVTSPITYGRPPPPGPPPPSPSAGFKIAFGHVFAFVLSLLPLWLV